VSYLVTVQQFREWAGANVPQTVPDSLIDQILNESESAIAQETQQPLTAIQGNPAALAIATGEELRRASRLLSRRNSPEGVAGMGESGLISISSRDPDSGNAIRQIRSILLTPEAVA
jgi:hypothetical protein